jgi:predicted amidohydrolase YtcJ
MKLALINGKIFTMDRNDSRYEALAIDGENIIHIGLTQEIFNLNINFDKIIDLQGQTVLPGFIDSHTHLGQIALESLWLDLSETTTKSQILEKLKSRINKTSEDEWVVGVNYDDSDWGESDSLTKIDLDELTSSHPIFVRRVCGHYAVVNSRALEQIDESWDYVNRDTGILLEDAVLGFMKIVKPDQDLRIKGAYTMMKKAHSLGLTAAREIVNYQTVKVYHELDKGNDLRLRIFGYITAYDLKEYLQDYPMGKLIGRNFQVIGLKILLDGSLGARTAALKEPYNDDPNNRGKLLFSTQELKELISTAKELGLSLMVHAIGDRAIQQFIDIYRQIYAEQIPYNPKGHSLEHVEVLDDQLLAELKDTGLWISAQPNFAGRWSIPGGLNEQRLGATRLTRCNAYKSILEKKIPMVFGSDCMPLNPMFGITSALNHPVQEQRISAMDAIKAYTKDCYNLLNFEGKFGTLEVGKIADLVILNHDVSNCTYEILKDLEVVGTIFNGELVFNDGLKII